MHFNMDKESTAHTDSIWTLLSHTGMYVTAIGLLIPAGLGLFCCYFFWCQPARSVHQPLQPGNMQYTIVDDDVEVAPSTDVMARIPSLQDLMRIMAWL